MSCMVVRGKKMIDFEQGIELVNNKALSHHSLSHLMGIEKIQVWEQPIDISDLRRIKAPKNNIILYSMQILGPIKFKKIRHNLTLHEFMVTDGLPNSWISCIVWNGDEQFLSQFTDGSYLNLLRVKLKYNSYIKDVQLSTSYNYKDQLEKVYF